MTQEKETQQELSKFSFNDESLKEEVKAPAFTINDTPLYKFEDKKSVIIKVLTELEILSRETKYGLKYYIPMEVKGETYYWQSSAGTLKSILDGTEDGVEKFNIMLNSVEKKYSIIPMEE